MGYQQTFERIKAGGVLLLDGGTGTELERRGVAMNDQAWCAMAAVTDFDTLVEVHADYIARGADVITVNAYASSRLMLEDAGHGERFAEINRRSCEAALTARDRSGRDDVLIAGSVSHMIPMQQGTQNSDPARRRSLDTIGAAFAELAALQKDCGCDLLLLEMMFDPPRMALAYEGAKATGLPVWAGLSARWADDGSVVGYQTVADVPFAEIVAAMADWQVDVAGIMHSPSDVTGPAIDILKTVHSGPLMAYPDSGYFEMPHWQFRDIIAPDDFVRFASQWRQSGVQILGGCCGLGPEHIAALASLKAA